VILLLRLVSRPAHRAPTPQKLTENVPSRGEAAAVAPIINAPTMFCYEVGAHGLTVK